MVFITTTVAPTAGQNNGEEPSVTLTTVFGITITVASLIFVYMNLIVIKIMASNDDMYKLSAYKFMIALGAADVVSASLNACTGVFTAVRFNYALLPYFGRAFDALAEPAIIFYSLSAIALAVNRFTLTYSPAAERQYFSRFGTKVWLGACAAVALLFFVAFASPYCRSGYSWRWLSWDYDYSAPYSHLAQRFSAVIEIGGISLAALLHLLVFAIILKKKHDYDINRSKNNRTEWRILIQSFAVTAYYVITDVLWHYSESLFPDTHLWYGVLNLTWVFNAAVNPVAYFFANMTMRQKMKSNFAHVTRVRGISSLHSTPSPRGDTNTAVAAKF